MADIPSYLPATPQDWQSIGVNPDGSLSYRRDNPEWTAQQLAQAQAQRQYLQELMQRQSPWTLNPQYVGKGIPERTARDSAPFYNILRMLSQATIGQPYGFMVPPTTEDVGSADEAVARARQQHNRARGLLE